jgi:chorismate lyase/3-hydroxybenzoate synthase
MSAAKPLSPAPDAACEAGVLQTLAPPAWVLDLFGDHVIHSRGVLECAESSDYTLITARVRNAASLVPREIELRTYESYMAIAEALAKSHARHAVRFWNHVPFITDPADAGRDNYMVFNAGRFRALSEWCGGTARFDREVATASATGHWGQDLVIHCLGSRTGGDAVNNPRQVAPYHYSQRFGPLPPCFARATAMRSPPGMLLVGGEDSVHADDLPGQLRETFLNLAALVAAARGEKFTQAHVSRALATFRELRVYFPDAESRAEIESAVMDEFRALRRLELLHADLCRAELLVEIEGLADVGALH